MIQTPWRPLKGNLLAAIGMCEDGRFTKSQAASLMRRSLALIEELELEIASLTQCPHCSGAGVRRSLRDSTPCDVCRGSGARQCGGDLWRQRDRMLGLLCRWTGHDDGSGIHLGGCGSESDGPCDCGLEEAEGFIDCLKTRDEIEANGGDCPDAPGMGHNWYSPEGDKLGAFRVCFSCFRREVYAGFGRAWVEVEEPRNTDGGDD